jgi:peptide deformylase
MILPIVAYGDPVLKTKAHPIEKDLPFLHDIIQNMWETMYAASGVGLAAPQIGQSIRLFLVDASPFSDEYPELKEFKRVFINPTIIEEWGDPWQFNEGCLSFPELREDIYRKPNIRMTYHDENFTSYESEFSGIAARIIQHEYDHIEGVVMIDRISPLKKTLIRKKLINITKGLVKHDYLMKFPSRKR